MNNSPIVMPPIIIEGEDLELFESVAYAESYCEPWDVDNDIRAAYDSEGRLLRARVVEERRNLFQRLFGGIQCVRIEPAESEPTHAEQLRVTLLEYLRVLGRREPALDYASLPQLIEELRPRVLPYRRRGPAKRA